MADHAGFAAALVLRESLLNDALLVAYASERFPRALKTALPDGPPNASIDAFLSPPEIACHDDGSLVLSIRLWGSLSVTTTGVVNQRTVDGHLQIRIQPRFEVSGTNLRLNPEPGHVIVSQWQFTTISGGLYPPDVQAYLESAIFRDRLQSTIQSAISHGIVNLPEIDVSFLGPLVAAADMTAATRVRDGRLMIGLDAEVHDDSVDVATHGNIDLVTDFTRNNDLAAVVNADVVQILMRAVDVVVRNEVAKHGATVDALTITPEAGRYRTDGVVSTSAGSATFSFALIPRLFHTQAGANFQYLTKPRHVNSRTWPALEFAIADTSIDVDRADWVILVEVVGALLKGAVVPLYVEDLVNSAAREFNAAISGADPHKTIPRVQKLDPVGPNGAPVRIELAEYEGSPDGVFFGVTVRPLPLPGLLFGPRTIPENHRGATLPYAVRLPFGLWADDPALRIRWTIIDLTSGTVLLNLDDIALGRDKLDIVPATFGPGLSHLGIGCRVYRTLGSDIADFLNDGITLEIRGPLPAGAYVRWRYDVKNPQVAFDEDTETFGYLGEVVRSRWSNIHRTDRPCAMASRRSRFTYETELLDALPFAVPDIAANRARICDYCFFGGPTGLRLSL